MEGAQGGVGWNVDVQNPASGYRPEVLEPQWSPQLVTDPTMQIVGAIRADLATQMEAMCKAWDRDRDGDSKLKDRGTYSGFTHEDTLAQVIMVATPR